MAKIAHPRKKQGKAAEAEFDGNLQAEDTKLLLTATREEAILAFDRKSARLARAEDELAQCGQANMENERGRDALIERLQVVRREVNQRTQDLQDVDFLYEMLAGLVRDVLHWTPNDFSKRELEAKINELVDGMKDRRGRRQQEARVETEMTNMKADDAAPSPKAPYEIPGSY